MTNYKLTIEEVLNMKHSLEEEINRLLMNFQAETGLKITDVEYDSTNLYHYSMIDGKRYSLLNFSVEIKL